MTSAPRNNSSSLRRALSILDVLAHRDGGAGLTLTELATSVDASKSTILRLLAPLLEASLVQQRSDGGYAIGVGAVTLGSAYLNNLDLRSVAQPVLARLAAESRETVHLMVYNEAQVVYVDKITGSSTIQMASRVGDRADVHSTASGKAILAHLSSAEFHRVVAAGLPAHTPRTLATARQLADDLRRVRERGYSIDDIENEEGIRCVAAPVFDHNGDVVAAISVSGPAERVGANLGALTALIVSGATHVSAKLGARTATKPHSESSSDLAKDRSS